MTSAISLRIGKIIGSVQTLNAAETAERNASASGAKENSMLHSKLESLCRALGKAVEQTEQYSHRLFAVHREQIIHLAVEIASRILSRQIQSNEYQIEAILTEAIATTPAGAILEIRVNPEDLKTYEQLTQSGQPGIGENIKLTADWSIGKAECIVVTTEGLVECTMQEHLRQIEAALQAAQASS